MRKLVGVKQEMPYTIDQIKSDKDSHFSGALATGAQEYEDLSFPDGYSEAQIQKLRIHRAVIVADNTNTTTLVPFYINFWGSDAASLATDPDLDLFQGRMEFAEGDLEQIGGGGLYRGIRDLGDSPMYYIDEDNSSELHVSLQNTDGSTAWHADDEVRITFFVEPIL